VTQGTKTFEKALELHLKRTPDVLSPAIKTIASEFKYEGLDYWSIEETRSATPTFRKILIGVLHIVDNSIASKDCVGIIRLQSLGVDRTLLCIPARNQWYINIQPETLPELRHKGGASRDDFCLYYDESYFAYFLDKLFAELRRLGFKETLPQKLWRLLKDINERIPRTTTI